MSAFASECVLVLVFVFMLRPNIPTRKMAHSLLCPTSHWSRMQPPICWKGNQAFDTAPESRMKEETRELPGSGESRISECNVGVANPKSEVQFKGGGVRSKQDFFFWEPLTASAGAEASIAVFYYSLVI